MALSPYPPFTSKDFSSDQLGELEVGRAQYVAKLNHQGKIQTTQC